MQTELRLLLIVLMLMAGVHQAAPQGAHFFRISGAAATQITAFGSGGTLIWTNARSGTNYFIQTVATLPGGTNWVDYVQLVVTQSVNTNQVVSFNPPAGMSFIPAGSFTMGDALDGESDAIPTVIVYVSAFYMDTNLISYSQWRSVYNWATNHGYGFDYSGSGKETNHPVQMVDWYDTVKWCNARSQQASLTPVYYTDAGLTLVYTNGDVFAVYANWSVNGYRLPTEAEWEKAARGGLSGQRFPWGDTVSESQANYYSFWYTGMPYYSYDVNVYSGYNTNFDTGAYPYTSPVGYFAPNGYGLYDMVGNLDEWCWDIPGTYAGGSDPHGPTSGSSRVLRGGNWNGNAYGARCASRSADDPPLGYDFVGFRCVTEF